MFIVPMTHSARPFGRACSQPFAHPFAHPLERLLDDRLVDRLINQSTPTEAAAARSPALDVTETATGYVVTLDMPGAAKEDIQVAVDGRLITVQAEVKAPVETKEGERVVYRERSAAKFNRSFKLPVEVDQADSVAKIDNGVLTLTLAKRSAAKGTHITVN